MACIDEAEGSGHRLKVSGSSRQRVYASSALGLLVGLVLGAASSSAGAQVHGYVEPCTVEFVEDGSMTCVECAPLTGDPDSCQERLLTQGYLRKCRTGGHSAPGEVWCQPKTGAPTGRGLVLLGEVFASVALCVTLFLWFRRRRSHR